MTDSLFPQLDQQAAQDMARFWSQYSDAVAQAATGPSALVESMKGSWTGDRARRFNQWWAGASTDLQTLALAANGIADGFRSFANGVPQINELLKRASDLLTSNAKPAPGGMEGKDPQGKPFFFEIPDKDFTLSKGDSIPLDGDFPSWFLTAVNLVTQALDEYTSLCSAADVMISQALGYLKQLSQIKEIGETTSSDLTGANSLSDPTWKQLTGGGIFRPNLPAGFSSNPFSGESLPDWYHQNSFTPIADFIAEHPGDIVNAASFFLAVCGEPEFAEALEIGYNSVKGVSDAVHGQWVDFGGDVAGLLLDIKWPSEDVNEVLSQCTLGGTFSKSVQTALQKTEHDISPEAAKHFGDYVQDHVEDNIKEQIKEAIASGKRPSEIRVSPDEMKRIYEDAANDLQINLATGSMPSASGNPHQSPSGVN